VVRLPLLAASRPVTDEAERLAASLGSASAVANSSGALIRPR
jgi:hypothetical protein